MHSLIIFSSGAGTNTAAIIDYFKKRKKVKISLIVTNNTNAGVIEIAKKEDIPFLIVNRKTIKETLILEQLGSYNPSLIVLAGFLWKIPQTILNTFPNKIINLHPALLPNYGGKGMFGQLVHKAVLEAGDEESGITIHYVNEYYDKGNIILQARCPVGNSQDEHNLAKKVRILEHYYLPRTIEFLLENSF